jgi:hypothetical protein
MFSKQFSERLKSTDKPSATVDPQIQINANKYDRIMRSLSVKVSFSFFFFLNSLQELIIINIVQVYNIYFSFIDYTSPESFIFPNEYNKMSFIIKFEISEEKQIIISFSFLFVL